MYNNIICNNIVHSMLTHKCSTCTVDFTCVRTLHVVCVRLYGVPNVTKIRAWRYELYPVILRHISRNITPGRLVNVIVIDLTN